MKQSIECQKSIGGALRGFRQTITGLHVKQIRAHDPVEAWFAKPSASATEMRLVEIRNQ